jgi:hypothetical protein
VCREDDDGQRGYVAANAPRRFKAINVRHRQIHQNYVGAIPQREVNGLQTIQCFTNDRGARYRHDETPKGLANATIVIGDEDSLHRRSSV